MIEQQTIVKTKRVVRFNGKDYSFLEWLDLLEHDTNDVLNGQTYSIEEIPL